MAGQVSSLMEGARNCIWGYTRIKEGEKVLVWTDRSGQVDEDILECFIRAIEEAKAEWVVISTKVTNPRFKEPLPVALKAALDKADALISLLELENAATVHTPHISSLFPKPHFRNTAVIALSADLMASEWARFPPELFWAIYRKVKERAEAGKDSTFRLTDENGTNLTGILKYEYGFKYVEPPKKWQFFPGGEMAENPANPVNGEIVFEVLEGFAGLLKEPVLMKVEEKRITHIEGGPEADWLKELMKRHEKSNYLCEVAIGTHPKAPISRGLETKAADTILLRHSGTYHCGLGVWGTDTCSPARLHWDGGGLKPTFTVGNQLIVDKGRLTALDDPEIRKLARKYGDPDKLLAETG